MAQWFCRNPSLAGYSQKREFTRTCKLVQGFDLLLRGCYNGLDQPHVKYKRLSWGMLTVDEILSSTDPNAVTVESVNDCIVPMQSVYHLDQGKPIVFDTGTTISVSPFKSDFESFERPTGRVELQGITAGAEVKGVGLVTWSICDDRGRRHQFRTRAYYVPQAQARLFSPQVFLHQPENRGKGGMFTVTDEVAVFVFPSNDAKICID